MTHEELQDRLDAFRDGELDDAEAAAIRAHLPGCASCRRTLAAQENLARLLRARPPASEAFVGRVMARIAEEDLAAAPARPQVGWWLAPAFGAAVMLAALGWPGLGTPAEDELIMADGGSWLFASRAPEADDVVTVAFGEQP
ncbi:MAG: zf-HC2 domain-containing protein [Elusimicrobia bacterium]|nr:zf-HC2 domain-containing protein [Elusimicrobiota bacterium]